MRAPPYEVRDQATDPSFRPEAVIPGSALIVGRNRIAEFKRDRRADVGRSRRPVRPGGRLLDAGQPEDAVLEYQETIQLKPDYSAAHRGLGRALEKADRLAEAETA